MKRNSFVIGLVLGILLSMAPLAFAREVYFHHQPIKVNTAVGRVTEVRFPTKVAKIIKGAVPESVSVEVVDQSIYILLKTSNPLDIFVMTEDGQSYPLNLVSSEEPDTKVEIAADQKSSKEPGNTQATIALIKEILLGNVPAGATVLQGDVEVFNNGQIALRLKTIYELTQCRVYILSAENLLEKRIVIPIQDINFPRLLAITSGQDLLEAKGGDKDQTTVYMVVGR